MNEDIEKVTIAVTNGAGVSTRTISDEYDVKATCWPNLVQVFLEQLQGLGYKFSATPDEMADVLDEYNQEIMCAECDGCEEDDSYMSGPSAVEEKKYPYTGVCNKENGITIVRFTNHNTGVCCYTEGHPLNRNGEYSENWAEEEFEKVSK